ncbi:Na+/H+ antiporter NhaA [Mumia zhuanghuii]|uniref:Na(+)/H(+) antiporter NhaA n=1 Tax=Mumia zhuanghuii TaxID=2585211 RepID=A0A5C4MGX1_9ACTN|nr:Na+/H+ antiporter NhaA [Mumia zhuanghuii]TNC34365.1 Na+/H+ antiporter NhaA [Mumia zhuanghuii]TNC35974.1 Na+/H+ antiporter NhaA [Mumia zhuanghuii]
MSHNNTVLGRGSWSETSRIAALLRQETVGGFLLIGAAALAIVLANSGLGDAYTTLRDARIGPESLHLDLTLGAWAADGLLAIFFFVAGLELKRELVAGDLRDPRRAAIPIFAAVGGMVVPALIFVAVNLGAGGSALRGWAIPTATDIAFALAVLAVLGSFLPTALRTFLLTLAIVDDLLAIVIIAFFYTDHLAVGWLAAALVPIGIFAVLVQRRVRSGWLLIPLALLAWGLVHASGVHATVAGVVLGFTVPVLRGKAAGGPEAGPGLAEHFEHLWRPVSAGIAVPIFAFLAAGVDVGGISGLVEANRSTITYGIVLGLVLGKTLGIVGATWLMARFTHARLDPTLGWIDVVGVGLLGGIGFTVSLLIGDLAYGLASTYDEYVKIGVLEGSVLSALLATVVLRLRNRRYRRISEEESLDDDRDGVPDVYQRDDDA